VNLRKDHYHTDPRSVIVCELGGVDRPRRWVVRTAWLQCGPSCLCRPVPHRCRVCLAASIILADGLSSLSASPTSNG